MASKIGVQSFVVRNYLGYAGKYRKQMLQEALDDFLQAEEEVKTGRLTDVMSVELLIVKYSAA